MTARRFDHIPDRDPLSNRLVRAQAWKCDCNPDAAIAWLDAVTEFALGDDEIAAVTIGAAAEHFLIAIARQQTKVGRR